MGDSNVSSGDDHMNIDTLRKLALLSMPKRQGRIMLSNPSSKSEGPAVFPSPAAKPPEDKEEGELSSDDDAEGATATLASVEPASNRAEVDLKSHTPSQGSSKEMLAPGANFSGSISNEGLSAASVAEAFLASLRIPVPKSSRAPGDDKKEDDFVIKFDDDSDSDGEHHQSLSSAARKLGRNPENPEKIVPGSVSLPQGTTISQTISTGPNQKPSGLKSEIDRMKKQIAAMERSKGKLPALPVVAKSTRVISSDVTRPTVSTASETKSAVQVGTGNVRYVPDLESLRLQIAAKESELQQRRQRLAARGPETSKVGCDAKGTGVGVPTTSVPSSCRTNKEGNCLAPPVSSAVSSLAEKTLLPIAKEVSKQAEGLIALASIGPLGVSVPSAKKDARLSGEGSGVEHQNVNEDITKFQSSSDGTCPSSSVVNQLVNKSGKRSYAGVDPLDKKKVARIDSGEPQLHNAVKADLSKEPAASDGACKSLAVQAGSQTKRKVDDIGTSDKSVMDMPEPSSRIGIDISKKLKLTTKSVRGDTSQAERFTNPKAYGPSQTQQGPRPVSTGSGQTQLHSEKMLRGITASSTQVVVSTYVADHTVRDTAREGGDGIWVQNAATVAEEASLGERFGGANTSVQVQSTEAPTLVEGFPRVAADEEEHVPKIQKPRFQYEKSHALPALAGVSVPDDAVAETVITESSGKRHGLVSSSQHVRGGNEVKSYLRPSSVLSPAEDHLEQPAKQSLGFGHFRTDVWDVDPDAETFEQLQAEEELLDTELEEAQEQRHRCEFRERVARKEYREAQRALREVSAQCELLNQRKEFLLSRIHLVEGRQFSRKLSASRKARLISSVGNSSLRLTGLEVASPYHPEEPATSVEHCAVSLPLRQPSSEPGSCGLDGGVMVAVEVGSISEDRQGPQGVSQDGASGMVQILKEDSSSTQVDTNIGSISGVAPADNGLQNRRESEKPAGMILGGRACDDCAPGGEHLSLSAGGSALVGLSIRADRSITEGRKIQTRSDASLPPSGHSRQQGKELLAVKGVSGYKLPCSVLAHGHVQTSSVGIDAVPITQGKQSVPVSSGSAVETAAVEITELSQDPCIVSGEKKQGMFPRMSGTDEGKTCPSKASIVPNKDDKSMAEGMVAAKDFVQNVPRIRLNGRSSEWQVTDVRGPVLSVFASSADVGSGSRQDPLTERLHTFQTPRNLKSGAPEALEFDSSVDLSLKGLSRNTRILAVSSSTRDVASDSPGFKDRYDSDSRKKREGQGVYSSVVDGKRNRISNTVVNKNGPIDLSPADLEELAAGYQGFSSEGIPLNEVEEPDRNTGINLSGEVTEGGCQLIENQDLPPSEPVEGNKTGPTTSNSGSCRRISLEIRRGFRERSAEDFLTCSDHVRPRESNETMSSKNPKAEEAKCQSTHPAGGFVDVDTVEPDEGIHPTESFEMSKKLTEVQIVENLEAVKGVEDCSDFSQPGSGPDFERQKTLVGDSSSTERNNLPAGQTIHEPKAQYSVSFRAAAPGNVVSTSDLCTAEVEVLNYSPEQIPSEICPHGHNPQQEQHVTVSLESDLQLVSECIPISEDVMTEVGLSPAIGDGHGDLQRQAVVPDIGENGHSVVLERNACREDEPERRVTSEGGTENGRHNGQNLDAPKVKESISGKVEANKGVEVEFFRKALLEGNVFKKSSGDEETVAMLRVQTRSGDADKEQILPQLQHHLLDQLLDIVEVGTQGTNVHGGGQSFKGPLIAALGCNGVLESQSAQVESSEGVSQLRGPAQVLVGEKAGASPNSRNMGLSDGPTASEPWVPSAVGFVSLRCTKGIVESPPGTSGTEKSSEVEEKECLSSDGNLLVYPRYESPLTVFRAYRSLPQFAGAMKLSSSSNTWSHAINPHKPLCRFEHRGQCRNEHCPWQHADDYTLANQISSEMLNKETRKAVTSDKADDTANTRLSAVSLIESSPALHKSGVGRPDKLETSGSLLSSNGFSLQGSPPSQLHDYDISVPTYRIGYCTLKAEDPNGMRLPGIQPKLKTEIYHSFLLSPSIHRILPPDSPCLLDSSKSKLSTVEASSSPQVPHWRYSGRLQEERIFSESGPLQVSKEVEMCVEVALNLIDFDLASDKHKARDEALCILSRGLETKQTSVTLWIAYSCLFHTRRDNPERDDMFQFAIQYNPGSYELWLLYINSRRDLPSRLEAYERAIVAIFAKGTQAGNLREDSSAQLLDLSLQMLYCMCISGCLQDALSWVEDLIHDTSATEEENCHRGSTFALLSYLSPHDACIIWTSCAYLSACSEMPLTVIRRLGCKQELSYSFDWATHASSEKVACLRTMKTLSTASSSKRGCLSLEDPHPATSSTKNDSKEILGVNYIQCLAFYEGLESAGRLSQHLIELYPTSVEMILLHARIEERRAGIDDGLHVFDKAVSRWPVGQPGLPRLWNQYAVHGLVWGGNRPAHEVLSRSVACTVQHASNQFGDTLTRRISKAGISAPHSDVSTVTNRENASSGIWNEAREHYVSLTSQSSRGSDGSSTVQSWHPEDMVYGLINLALIEALSGDRVAAQSTINKAMKFTVSDRDSRQCWKELASLQLLDDDKEHKILGLLDRCKTESYNLSQLKPLSLRVLEDLKRPQVRKFFVDLLGLLPVDHSLLNTILETCYGPSLLPFESLIPKEVCHFAEGILEAAPGNVELALSLCKLVFQESGSSRSKSFPSRFWASALLISSLQQSCPSAPEVYWVESGLLLKQLSKGKSLEEYYLHALLKYPFSAALRHGLAEARLQIEESDGRRGGDRQVDMVRDVAGLIEG